MQRLKLGARHPPWRGSLLPLGCAAAPIQATRSSSDMALTGFTTAAQPSGSKLPRHGSRMA
ncbi:hypothetical protein DZG01_07270 [Pseudomonas fluorescens]|nr:hypothetical protein DZG01_07270 [Pseudomonas fluorescens]